jgi:hypothetical protein
VTTTAPRAMGAAEEIVEIDVVVSDRVEDIDEALAVIHDGFVEAGYTEPQPSGRRMHPAYLNPGTMFIIARMDGRAVGTCALICDGPFGLPSDRAFAEENDALRQTVPLLREGGSLAVRSDARRHTRRIMMRLTAAISRMAAAESPHGDVVIAIAPENRRFYSSVLGAEPITGERPYFGAPAVLLRTTGAEIGAHCSRRETVLQRAMHGLLTERHPSWLSDRRSHLPYPSSWLAALIEEQGVTQRMRAQVGLMAARYPEALHGIISDATPRVVA